MKVKLPRPDPSILAYLLSPTYLTFAKLINGNCAICHHVWHDRPCRVTNGWQDCHCEASWTRLDDTWRPMIGPRDEDWAVRIMHDTGVDGWAALACVGTTPDQLRTKRALYGKKS